MSSINNMYKINDEIALDVTFSTDDDNYVSDGTLPNISITKASISGTSLGTPLPIRVSEGKYICYVTFSEINVGNWNVTWNITIGGQTETKSEEITVYGETQLVLNLRERISDWKDGDSEKQVFSTSELSGLLSSAVGEYAPDKDVSELSSEESSLVLILSHSYVCEKLATDTAKYFKYTEGQSGDNVDKTMTPDMFLKLAKHLRKTYDDRIKNKLKAKEIDTNLSGSISSGGKLISWR